MSAAVRPDVRPLDLRGGLHKALVALEISPVKYAQHVIVFVEGSPPALASRAAWIRYAEPRDAALAWLLAHEQPAPGWILTLKIAKSFSLAGAIVGTLKLAPRSTP